MVGGGKELLAGFKNCCMLGGRFDGSERNQFFQRLESRKSREMWRREIAVGAVKMSEPPLPSRAARHWWVRTPRKTATTRVTSEAQNGMRVIPCNPTFKYSLSAAASRASARQCT